MKCYYEVLKLPRDSNDDEIKKAYRKLALQWHPDKNLNNIEEANVQFQLVQQAYEVLSDHNERAFYDKHRESILKGGSGSNYVDISLDVFQFFTTSCFAGYGDDEKGFYSVYREVFNKIAAEDSEYNSDLDSDFEIPSFGKSDSPYEDVVQPFYSYWQGYSTKKSYTWLNLYDIKDAPNRKVVRVMEKENKKVRDEARKARNEEIRALVEFVKKRDKRIKAHAIYMEEKKKMNMKKSEDQRQMKLKERKDEMASYQESEWTKFSNLEKELKDIEANLAAEFGDNSEMEELSHDSDSDECKRLDTLYCVACNKIFKTSRAFQNHENSKKHKDNLILLKSSVLDDDSNLYGMDNDTDKETFDEKITTSNGPSKLINENEELTEDNKRECYLKTVHAFETKIGIESTKKKSKKTKNKCQFNNAELLHDSEFSFNKCAGSSEDLVGLVGASKKQKKNIMRQQILLEEINKSVGSNNLDSKTTDTPENSQLLQKGKKFKKSKNKVSPTNIQESSSPSIESNSTDTSNTLLLSDNISNINQPKDTDCGNKQLNICHTCESSFTSRNKLFDHIKKSGHDVYVGLPSKESKTTSKSKKKLKK